MTSYDINWREKLFEHLSDNEREVLEEYEYHLQSRWLKYNGSEEAHIRRCEKRHCLNCEQIFDKQDAWLEMKMTRKVHHMSLAVNGPVQTSPRPSAAETPLALSENSDTILVSSTDTEICSSPSCAQIPTAVVEPTPSAEIPAPVTQTANQELETHLSDRSNCRFKGKNLFLTYPKCPVPKEEMADQLLIDFNHWKPHQIVVGHELHADGTDHLHCLVRLHGSIDTTNARFADALGYHGDYRVCRNVHAVLNYVKKKGDFHEWPAPAAAKDKPSAKKRKITSVLSEAILAGTSTNTLVHNKDYSSFLLTNLTKVRTFEQFVRSTEKPTLLPWPKIRTDLTPQNSTILRWIALNVFAPRTLRQKQLFLYGPPATGKTTFSQLIAGIMKTYFPSLGEKYFDGLTHDHDLIIFDEFVGGTQLSIMNQILDGQACILPCRYQHFFKTRNVPVIVLSNISPEECYKNAHHLRVQAFASRFTIVHVTDMIEIFL